MTPPIHIHDRSALFCCHSADHSIRLSFLSLLFKLCTCPHEDTLRGKHAARVPDVSYSDIQVKRALRNRITTIIDALNTILKHDSEVYTNPLKSFCVTHDIDFLALQETGRVTRRPGPSATTICWRGAPTAWSLASAALG